MYVTLASFCNCKTCVVIVVNFIKHSTLLLQHSEKSSDWALYKRHCSVHLNSLLSYFVNLILRFSPICRYNVSYLDFFLICKALLSTDLKSYCFKLNNILMFCMYVVHGVSVSHKVSFNKEKAGSKILLTTPGNTEEFIKKLCVECGVRSISIPDSDCWHNK